MPILRQLSPPVKSRLTPMNAGELFDLICPVPNPWDTLEQLERYEHRDLGRLSRAELLRERERVWFRILLDDAPDLWLFGRLDSLRTALGDAR